jgi:hypothetical protein
MQTAKWTCSLLLACALLLLLSGSCSDAPTPPNSSAASRINGVADASFSRDGDDDDAEGICGVIAETRVIRENTKLTCNVECTNITGPCIQFGAHRITLWLNGYTMTGRATPPANCASSPAFGPGDPGPFPYDGISTAGFDHVRILGPGMVQRFRRHGIFMLESQKSTVGGVTPHHNCYSGILLGFSHQNDITDNVSVRNGSASGAAPCGGNCVVNSNGNRIRRNHYYGNGSVAPGTPLGTPNDFGLGFVGTSSYNIAEDNRIGGNINGILLFPMTGGNVIRRNIIAGNPPVQVSVSAGSPVPDVGADIRDASTTGTNTFEDNHCITYEGTKMPRPCPSFARSRRDHRSGDDR